MRGEGELGQSDRNHTNWPLAIKTTIMEYYKECGYDIQDGKAIIPEGVTEIRDQVFRDCKEITSISFPSSVKKIEGFELRY